MPSPLGRAVPDRVLPEPIFPPCTFVASFVPPVQVHVTNPLPLPLEGFTFTFTFTIIVTLYWICSY